MVRRLCGIGWIRYSGVSRQDVLRASSGCDSPDVPRRLAPCSSGTGTGLEPASLLWSFSTDGLPLGEELARDPFRSDGSAHGPAIPRRHAGPSPAVVSVKLCKFLPGMREDFIRLPLVAARGAVLLRRLTSPAAPRADTGATACAPADPKAATPPRPAAYGSILGGGSTTESVHTVGRATRHPPQPTSWNASRSNNRGSNMAITKPQLRPKFRDQSRPRGLRRDSSWHGG